MPQAQGIDAAQAAKTTQIGLVHESPICDSKCALKTAYNPVLTEPIPSDWSDLLRKLA